MAKRKGPGRPTKFSEKLARQIISLAEKGCTEKEIAEECGICLATLKNWKSDIPGFLAAVRAAKDVADELVEAALFHRAVGYQHPAVKFFYDSESGEVTLQSYTEHYPPDTGACKFWLSNRKPKRWRDKQVTEHQGEIKTSTNFTIINRPNGEQTVMKAEIKDDKGGKS